jgi:hypothetical protein
MQPGGHSYPRSAPEACVAADETVLATDDSDLATAPIASASDRQSGRTRSCIHGANGLGDAWIGATHHLVENVADLGVTDSGVPTLLHS